MYLCHLGMVYEKAGRTKLNLSSLRYFNLLVSIKGIDILFQLLGFIVLTIVQKPILLTL